MKLSELQEKEVINCHDGKRAGCITDIEFDQKCGNIISIVIQASDKFFGLFGGSEILVPWNKIVVIGEDVIIIDA